MGLTSNMTNALKDQIALLASLTTLVGIVATDAYYTYFGLSYQFLNLPASHILYRGLTMPVTSPSIVIPYVVGVLWLIIESMISAGAAASRRWLIPVPYAVILLVLVITYPLAYQSAIAAAQRDITDGDTLLPEVTRLVSDNDDQRHPGLRLLVVDSNFATFVKPVAKEDRNTYVPNLIRLRKDDIKQLHTLPPRAQGSGGQPRATGGNQ
jgi:hypothetical protein